VTPAAEDHVKQAMDWNLRSFPELDGVFEAVRRLYDAALDVLPAGIETSPKAQSAREKFNAEALTWQHKVARAFGALEDRTPDQKGVYSEGSLLRVLHYWQRAEGDPEDITDAMAKQWPLRVPGLFLGLPPHELKVDYDRRSTWGSAIPCEGMALMRVPEAEWSRQCVHVKWVLLRSRTRALALVQWVLEAVERYVSIWYPRIWIRPTGKSVNEVFVEQAGVTSKYDGIPDNQVEFLRRLLAEENVAIGKYVKSNLVKAIRELRPFIHDVKHKGRFRENHACYALHEAMKFDQTGRPRITFLNKATDTQLGY
jgi:hypothetical protein